MSDIRTFRIVIESDDCLLVFTSINEEEAMALVRIIRNSNSGRRASVHPIVCNTDPKRAEYEYRSFDIVALDNKYAMVLCLDKDKEPEFHGFKSTEGDCFKYIDEYWYNESRKGNTNV